MAMQKAVDIVLSSEHPTSKVAACLFKGDAYVCHTNQWPKAIKDNYPMDQKFGNSSGTIHAETACIIDVGFATEGASIAITDPFCPNCAKNIAEAGIKTIYVDHKGFQKDFFVRREHEFKNMSMRVIEKAGISVYEIWRKEERLVPILEVNNDYVPAQDNPIETDKIAEVSTPSFYKLLHQKSEKYAGNKIAVCLAQKHDGQIIGLTARSHAAVGYKMADDKEQLFNTDGKYTFKLEPINRLLMNAPRLGAKIINGYIYCSQVPTAREQVNMVGAGLSKIYIGDMKRARDESALEAMKILKASSVSSFLTL